MFTRWMMLIAFVGFVAVSSACSGHQSLHRESSMLEQNWGRSFESQKYNQILHPDAGKNLSPVTGLDGQAAEKSMEKYRESDARQSTSPEFGIVTIKK